MLTEGVGVAHKRKKDTLANSTRVAQLLDIVRPDVIHDYEETAYRIKFPSRVPLLLSADTMHEATDEQWRMFLLELKSIFRGG